MRSWTLQVSSGQEVVEVLAEVEGYEHLGFRGKLSLHFLNDMLARAFFSPERIEGYIAQLDRVEGIDLRDRSNHVQRQATIIWSSREPGWEQFVGWRDERIIHRFNPPSE